jgi:endonuclease/exonuclease/phosphatase family metal-dependent hydrolase
MSLRVMTYNILDGGENREAHILDVIQAVSPDVVILQEVFAEELLKILSRWE